MEERDFNWCFNHENLFRDWLYFRYDCIHSNELDPATIFDLWQDAKKYALEIANSKDPVLFYWTKMDYWIAESRRHIFWLSDSCQQASLLLKFLNSMLASSKNKKLELFADIGDNVFIDYVIKWKKDPNSKFELDTKPFYGMIHPLLMPGQIESDYDYSLPDGGIKDETITQTQTKTGTDETITDAGTAENNETLLKELTPIFYGDEKRAEDYIKNIKKTTNDVEKVQYTAQLVNENTISERSCHRVLYRILHDHGLYNKTETNWNKVISQHLFKK